MERKKATDFPQELLNMFDQYVHGDINRRQFLEGANRFAIGGLTATALFESLRPHFAWAQQVAKDDSRIKTESHRSLAARQWQHPRLPGASCQCQWQVAWRAGRA